MTRSLKQTLIIDSTTAKLTRKSVVFLFSIFASVVVTRSGVWMSRKCPGFLHLTPLPNHSDLGQVSLRKKNISLFFWKKSFTSMKVNKPLFSGQFTAPHRNTRRGFGRGQKIDIESCKVKNEIPFHMEKIFLDTESCIISSFFIGETE